jgi:enoyl-CoA hydratase
MTDSAVHFDLQGPVAVLRLDDGKANAISHAVLDGLHAALDRASREAAAVVLAGRPGRFSAGFDLKTFSQGPAATAALVTAGARLALRLYGHPQPVVAACTGHAIAMGAILLLACDVRIGADGDHQIGLNEVAIGMTLPRFGVELARDRLSRRHLGSAVFLARMFSPAAACDAGYLDRTCAADRVVAEAIDEATRLAQLRRPAVGETKLRLRAATIERVEATLEDDIRGLTGSSPRPE